MFLEKIAAGLLRVNCYLVGDEKEVMMIDPGGSAEKILSRVSQLSLTVKYIVLTHCHFDHILAVETVKNATGAKVVMCKQEVPNFLDSSVNMTSRFSKLPLELHPDVTVSEGDQIHVGGITFSVIETPGHTSGGMCLYSEQEGVLFSGDTLFCNSIGRTDFPSGNHEVLINSIATKLFTLPESVRVYPGHDTDTTIGQEKQYNPFI